MADGVGNTESNQLIDRPVYYKAAVVDLVKEGVVSVGGVSSPFQELRLKVISGSKVGQVVDVKHGVSATISELQKVKKGEVVVLSEVQADTGLTYIISDKYRFDGVIISFVAFVSLAVIFAKFKGLMSILGLIISALIISYFMVPRIIAGDNPILITLVGTVLIAVTSIYLAHGFSDRTTLALVSILITMVFSVVLAILGVDLLLLTGSGSEEAYFLQIATQKVNLKGLLLGGLIMGALGVLDDITTAQTAIVHELKVANPKLSWTDLYKKGISVGTEHITALVNTLFLAYAGASLPLFLLLTLNTSQPLWVLFNSEFLVEEIIRTLIGSASLIIAVPISTFVAAYYFKFGD